MLFLFGLGYNVELSAEQIKDALSTVGCCIAGQTEKIAPADKVPIRLYGKV